MRHLTVLILVLFCTAFLPAQSVMMPGPGGVVVSSPTIPTSGLQAWFAADSGSNCSGSPCSNGGFQDTWADKSINANNASRSGSSCAGSVPIYNTNQINGLPAVTFLKVNPSCMILSSAVNLQTASSIFYVVKLTSTSGISPVFGGGTNSYVADMARSTEQGGTKSNVAVLGAGSAATDTSWHQLNQTYDGTTIAFRIDRASDGSASPSVAITANSTTIGKDVGSSDLFGGQIAELIIYDRVLSGGEITQVETYLNGRYGL